MINLQAGIMVTAFATTVTDKTVLAVLLCNHQVANCLQTNIPPGISNERHGYAQTSSTRASIQPLSKISPAATPQQKIHTCKKLHIPNGQNK